VFIADIFFLKFRRKIGVIHVIISVFLKEKAQTEKKNVFLQKKKNIIFLRVKK